MQVFPSEGLSAEFGDRGAIGARAPGRLRRPAPEPGTSRWPATPRDAPESRWHACRSRTPRRRWIGREQAPACAPGRCATGAGRSGRWRGGILDELSVEVDHCPGGFRPRRQGQLPDRRDVGPGSQQLLDGPGVIPELDRPLSTLIQSGAVQSGAAGRGRVDDPPAELQRGDQDPTGVQPPILQGGPRARAHHGTDPGTGRGHPAP